MSKFNIPTVRASCPACAVQGTHRVTFEDKQVRHLRCELCSALHVSLHKGSFHSSIHPLSFAEVIDLGREEECDSYKSTSAFQPTDLFRHPSFGLGYVVSVFSPPKKMEVMFADKIRVLVCGPGSGATVPEQEADKKTGQD